MWSWKFSTETKWPTHASLRKACDSSETVRFSKNMRKPQFLCNSPQNIVDIMESGLTEPPDIELIHADEPPPPGSNLEIKMEMLGQDENEGTCVCVIIKDICIFVKTFGNRTHSGARFL